MDNIQPLKLERKEMPVRCGDRCRPGAAVYGPRQMARVFVAMTSPKPCRVRVTVLQGMVIPVDADSAVRLTCLYAAWGQQFDGIRTSHEAVKLETDFDGEGDWTQLDLIRGG